MRQFKTRHHEMHRSGFLIRELHVFLCTTHESKNDLLKRPIEMLLKQLYAFKF